MTCAIAVETLALGLAKESFLAEDVLSLRPNPASTNSTVEGYGFAGPAPAGRRTMSLAHGRATAGSPFDGPFPEGTALRILTDACLPPGVDTVVSDENAGVEDGFVTFHGPVHMGANTRSVGEDVKGAKSSSALEPVLDHLNSPYLRPLMYLSCPFADV